jgi:hypothetical protein
MQFSLAQRVVYEIDSFITHPGEVWLPDGKTLDWLEPLEYLSDWLYVWLLLGGSKRCLDDFGIYMQAVVVAAAERERFPDHFQPDVSYALPSLKGIFPPATQPLVNSDDPDTRGYQSSPMYLMPLSLTPEFFRWSARLDSENAQALIGQFINNPEEARYFLPMSANRF